jgi:hypothetical protein
MISKVAMLDELMKIGFATNAYSGSMNPEIRDDNSYMPAPKVPIPRAPTYSGTGQGSEPTRGGFLLASKQASPLTREDLIGGDAPEDVERENIEKQKEKHVFNGDHMQHLIDEARGDGVDRGKTKDSESLKEYIPYKSSDFKRAKMAWAKLAFSPAGQLGKSTHKFTVPNVKGHTALSIEQVAKPTGFGRKGAVPATDKGGQI